MENDNNITCMAGEFLTVGKLSKKRLEATITFGSAKAIDIFAYNTEIKKKYAVQVKTQKKSKKDFFLEGKRVENDIIFVFVALNDFEEDEEYFIVEGSEILKDVKKFFGPAMSAVRYNSLADYKDNWKVFDE